MRSFAIFILSLSTLCPMLAQDYWVPRDSVNGGAKSVCGAFSILDQGYIVGGLDDFGFKRKMYSYDPFQDDWDDEESIGGLNGGGLDRGSATAFSIGLKGYVCLGQGETAPYMNDLWEYDLQTGAWSQKADFIGGPRKQAVGFVINNIAYVGTGQAANGLKNDFYTYDPTTNTWEQINDFPGTARRQAVAFSTGTFGWLGTGDDGTLKKDFWMYDPLTDSWIQKTDFPGTPRSGAVGWSTFPTVFIALGEDNTFAYKKDVWEYNYYSNAWVQRIDFPGEGRKNAVAFVINDVAYVGTGYNGEFKDDMYAYYGVAGMQEYEISTNTMAYPNPASSSVQLNVLDPGAVKDIEVYNSVGQLINTINFETFAKGIQLDVHALANGSYFYSLNHGSSDKQLFGKFIVKR